MYPVEIISGALRGQGEDRVPVLLCRARDVMKGLIPSQAHLQRFAGRNLFKPKLGPNERHRTDQRRNIDDVIGNNIFAGIISFFHLTT